MLRAQPDSLQRVFFLALSKQMYMSACDLHGQKITYFGRAEFISLFPEP